MGAHWPQGWAVGALTVQYERSGDKVGHVQGGSSTGPIWAKHTVWLGSGKMVGTQPDPVGPGDRALDAGSAAF